MSPPPQNQVLIIRLGAMGDLLHMSPSIRVLKAHCPDMTIHVLTSPTYQALVTQFPDVDQVWTFEKGQNILETGKHLINLAKALKESGVNKTITLQPNFRSWLLARLILGFFPSSDALSLYQKEKLRLTPKDERRTLRRHAVTDFYQPFKTLFPLPDFDHTRLIPEIPSFQTPKNKKESGQPIQIGIIPGVGNKRANRAWPLDYYIILIKNLLQTCNSPIHLVLIGGSDEKKLANQLETGLKEDSFPNLTLKNVCGSLNLLETAQLASQCDLIIGGDTGPLHLAAAVGTPLIAIYGPTSPKRTGALGHQPIITITPPESLDFWPCETPDCTSHSTNPNTCIRSITPKKVLEACLKHLSDFLK